VIITHPVAVGEPPPVPVKPPPPPLQASEKARPVSSTALPPARPQTPPIAHRVVDHGASTTFGSDLISERSLDEVILSYLADDLQED